MSILQQIKNDIRTIKQIISTIDGSTVRCNGGWLKGQELKEAIECAKAENVIRLQQLELILESGVIPNPYFSIVTNTNYLPSEEELKQISKPLPKAHHTYFTLKNSRKDDPAMKLSNFTIVEDDAKKVMSFFIEHDQKKAYPSGGFAQKIKKGFLKENDVKPAYAIKIYRNDIFEGNTIEELRIAMRSAYCYHQLGRSGLSFRHNDKQYMVTEWLQGVNLDCANQDQIKLIPMARRIVMAISLLRELSILHRQGLIHHDIKPDNVIIDYGWLRFVDLDSVTPLNSSFINNTNPMCTPGFLPTAQMNYDLFNNPKALKNKLNVLTDLFQIGITLTYLFQEIYIPKMSEEKIAVNGGTTPSTFTNKEFQFTHGTEYDKHPALQKLLKSMICQDDASPKSADECINQLKDILKTYPNYLQYLKEDRLIGVGKNLSLKDGENAFRQIEFELLGFNQRAEAVTKLPIR